MSFKIGDKVVVTDDVISGKVVAIGNNDISVETEDGFILKYAENELIKIGETQSEIAKKSFISFDVSEKIDYQKGKNKTKIKRKKESIPPMEVDLHINKLIKSSRGMDNYDMLTLQMDTAKHKLEFAIRNRIPRIVFIHGVGEGVLKEELGFLLRRYNVRYNEASYQKYGLGATEVYILQHKKE